MTIPLPLAQWAARHAITPAALADLLTLLGAGEQAAPPIEPGRTREGYVQSVVRLEAPRHGVWLSRCNTGAGKFVDEKNPDAPARYVRFGLANESSQQNDVIKCSDLIGVRALTITPAHVGSTVGQFVAREVKHAGWTWGEDPKRETAQLAFLSLVTRYGGDARFVTGPGSFE